MAEWSYSALGQELTLPILYTCFLHGQTFVVTLVPIFAFYT